MVTDGKRQHPSPSPAPMEKAAAAIAREEKLARETDPPFLPIEVWTEILLRIPAEFLVELKFVCKVWYELITSQSFALSHLDHWTSRPDNGFAIDMYHLSDGLLIRSIFYFTLHMSCEERKLQCRNFLIEDYNHYRRKQSRKEDRLLASCDGLLLIGCDEETHCQFLICNPITGSHRRLPILRTEFVRPLGISDFYVWAMVRNGSSYKVFGMPTYPDLQRTCHVLELQRAGEAGLWQDLEFEVPVTLEWWIRASRTTEGKVHWLVGTSRPPHARILSIDILTYEITTSASINFVPETDDYFVWDGTLYCTKRRK